MNSSIARTHKLSHLQSKWSPINSSKRTSAFNFRTKLKQKKIKQNESTNKHNNNSHAQ